MAVSMAALGAAVPSANAAEAVVTINAPNAPAAGTVTLTGRVGGAGDITTVLYVVDTTDTTSSPTNADCSGNGATGAEDDLNGDGNVGDVLDCEIAGVVALDRSLAGKPGVQVGLVGFANDAAAADLDPGAGAATFVAPGAPAVEAVARSLVRNRIGLYEPKDLGGSGDRTAFNDAVATSLSTLGTAPAGPKYIMFLSDGLVPVSDATLEQLRQSGVRLRSFGIGSRASCGPFGSLYKMASATAEKCELVTNPAALAAELTGSQPDAVNGVTVTIGGVSVAANLDAVGGWRADFTLGAGTYTATAKAVLASGNTVSAQRTFTVAPSAGGPPPGTVTPGPGALKATVVKVFTPKPTRAVLPSRVTGRVGGLKVTKKLAGSRVLLQARPTAGAPWTTVDRDKVDKSGKFALTWKPKSRLRLLRVALQPYKGYAGSAAAVPAAKISACKVAKRGGGYSVTCQTTAKAGSKVSLLKNGNVIDRARVRSGAFRLNGTGPVGAASIDITVSKRRHIRLAL